MNILTSRYILTYNNCGSVSRYVGIINIYILYASILSVEYNKELYVCNKSIQY